MNDRQLRDLLSLVDDPEPVATDFKTRLRSELGTTLLRTPPLNDVVIEIEHTDRGPARAARRSTVLAIAATVVVGVAGLLLVDATRGDDEPAAPSASTVPSSTTTTTTLPVATTTGAACDRFVETLASAGDLEGFRQGISPAPDMPTVAGAVAVLTIDLDAAGDLTEGLERSLGLIGGAIDQATAELAAGDDGAAAGSVGFALDQLRALEFNELPGCIPRQ